MKVKCSKKEFMGDIRNFKFSMIWNESLPDREMIIN